MCFITNKHQNKEDLHSKIMPPPPQKKKQKKKKHAAYGYSEAYPGFLTRGCWYQSLRPPNYMQIYFKLPFVCPQKLQIRNSNTTFLLFSLLHHHNPHIPIVFTPPIVFLPHRPKRLTSGQNSQIRPKSQSLAKKSHSNNLSSRKTTGGVKTIEMRWCWENNRNVMVVVVVGKQ